jgi:uncharacterized protein with ParB-like and HNH nuclease domain
MSTGVKLEPVADLLTKEFFIRSYQRGYRWNADQIGDLLDDLKDFIDQPDKEEEEFYCLQPIVVKLLSVEEKQILSRFSFSNETVYEVIDGQQRITSITILLHYLVKSLEKEIELDHYPVISYEVRPQSMEVLSRFSHFIHSQDESSEMEDNIDFYHMKVVYETISQWFSERQAYRLAFLKLLTSYKINCVKVIWYEVDASESSIEVFRRFNVGKIPLSNAELIKAIFLREDKNTPDAIKYSISKEWQQIENHLQSVYFWGFLSPSKNYSSRIEYIFDLLYEKKKKQLKNEQEKTTFERNYGTDKHKVFRYFFSCITKAEDLLTVWDKVNETFEKLMQWYSHPEHYHYIGYLQNRERRLKNENVPLDILCYLNLDTGSTFQNKEELTQYLITSISSKSKMFFDQGKIKLKYGDPLPYLRNLFFLFNVETCVKMSLSSSGEEIYRLPFSLNSSSAYDIEHIDSKTEKEITSLKPQEKIEYLRDIETDFAYEIGSAFSKALSGLFSSMDIKDKWADSNIDMLQLDTVLLKALELTDQLFEKDPDRFEDKNVIGNLTLLNDFINRSYGNSFFNTKRRLIIEKDKEGTYIPVTTKNIFLKYYSGIVRKHTRWSSSDAVNYTNDLETTLAKFMLL